MTNEIKQEASNRRLTCSVHSTDDFHLELRGGIFEYVFKPQQLAFFHKRNLEDATKAMEFGVNYVIIDNTNTTWKEIEGYVKAGISNGYSVEVKEPNTSWKFDAIECSNRNTHKVPLSAIKKMLERWEETSLIEAKIKQLETKSVKHS